MGWWVVLMWGSPRDVIVRFGSETWETPGTVMLEIQHLVGRVGRMRTVVPAG